MSRYRVCGVWGSGIRAWDEPCLPSGTVVFVAQRSRPHEWFGPRPVTWECSSNRPFDNGIEDLHPEGLGIVVRAESRHDAGRWRGVEGPRARVRMIPPGPREDAALATMGWRKDPGRPAGYIKV